MPKISVIIPVYNVEKYLEQCLDSVVNQTLKDIEIICVNDGSKDGSLAILKKYQKNDSRIKIICQWNRGLGAARNTGIKAAKGEYLFYLDSDDWIDLTCLEKLYNKVIEDNAEVCILGCTTYDDCTHEYNRTSPYYNLFKYSECKDSVVNYKSIKNALFTRFEAGLKLQKRDFVLKNKLFFHEGVIFEDIVVSIKTLILASKITFVDENLFFYRINRKGSLMDTVKNNKHTFDALKYFDGVFKFINKKKLMPELEYYFYIFVLWQLNYHLSQLDCSKLKFEFFKKMDKFMKKIKLDENLNKYPDLPERYSKIVQQFS